MDHQDGQGADVILAGKLDGGFRVHLAEDDIRVLFRGRFLPFWTEKTRCLVAFVPWRKTCGSDRSLW